jgi:hypothetical protein
MLGVCVPVTEGVVDAVMEAVLVPVSDAVFVGVPVFV